MTRNEILDIAREFYTNGGVCEREIAFARFVMAKEREACAKVCEEQEDDGGEWDIQQQCANAIRARGQQ